MLTAGSKKLLSYALFVAAGGIVLWWVSGWFGGPSLPTCPSWGATIVQGTSCFQLPSVGEAGLDVGGTRMDLHIEGNGRYLIFDRNGLVQDFVAADACVIVQPPDTHFKIYQGSIIHIRVMARGENPPGCFFKH